MLSIDFETLTSKYPDLQDAWRGLQAWVRAHPDVSYIDTRRVTAEVPMEHFDPFLLALALNCLKSDAGFKQVYMVFDPRTNQFLRGVWNHRKSVPESVPDAFDNHIQISNLRIVPVLARAEEMKWTTAPKHQ